MYELRSYQLHPGYGSVPKLLEAFKKGWVGLEEQDISASHRKKKGQEATTTNNKLPHPTTNRRLPDKVAADPEGGALVMFGYTDVGMLNHVVELWRYKSAQACIRWVVLAVQAVHGWFGWYRWRRGGVWRGGVVWPPGEVA